MQSSRQRFRFACTIAYTKDSIEATKDATPAPMMAAFVRLAPVPPPLGFSDIVKTVQTAADNARPTNGNPDAWSRGTRSSSVNEDGNIKLRYNMYFHF